MDSVRGTGTGGTDSRPGWLGIVRYGVCLVWYRVFEYGMVTVGGEQQWEHLNTLILIMMTIIM
jgi:hypothetical protein